MPSNPNPKSKEEEFTKLDHLELKKKKSTTIEEEELELTNMVSKTKAPPMETSWSLSLSPWRVKLSLLFSQTYAGWKHFFQSDLMDLSLHRRGRIQKETLKPRRW